MKRIAIMCVSAAFAVAAAGGQAAAQAPTASGPVDPAKLQLAQQVVAASGGEKQAAAAMNGIYSAMSEAMSKSLPPEQARLIANMQQTMQRDLMKMLPALMDISARAFASDLSQTELRDLLAWTRSASGQAIVQKQPAIMRHIMADEMPMIMAMLPSTMQHVVDEVCTQQHCTAEQRQTIAAAVTQALHGHAS